MKVSQKSAVEQFVDSTSVTSLIGVIGFSNAVLKDYVKGRMSKTEAVNILHVLETGPARHIHATIEKAAQVGHALQPIIGLPSRKQLTAGQPDPQSSEPQPLEAEYEE